MAGNHYSSENSDPTILEMIIYNSAQRMFALSHTKSLSKQRVDK